MKNIFHINLVFLLIVIGFHCFELLYGALLQIPLGAAHIVFAILLYKDRKELQPNHQKLLKFYWYSLLIWFCSFVVFTNLLGYDNVYNVFLFIIPMILGIYFVLITYLIQKKHEPS